MKKIMKKFLSSLLALTMILSLVIVPANAATTEGATGSFTISGPTTASEGDTVNFSISSAKITYQNQEYPATVTNVNWGGLTLGTTDSNNSYSGRAGSSNLTITCTATLSAQVGDSEPKTTVTVESQAASNNNYSVTVTSKQAAFEAAVKQATVTFKGRTYPANSGTTTFAIDLFGSETLPTSGTDMPTISVSDPYKSTTLVYDTTNSNNSKWVAQYGTGDSALSCDVTLNATKVSPDPTVSISNNLPVNTKAISGQKVSLTANYSRKVPGKNITYAWSASNGAEISGMVQVQHGRLRVLVRTRLLPSSFMKAGLRLQDMLRPTTLMPTTTKSRLSITRPLTRFRALLLSRFPLLHFTTRPLATA